MANNVRMATRVKSEFMRTPVLEQVSDKYRASSSLGRDDDVIGQRAVRTIAYLVVLHGGASTVTVEPIKVIRSTRHPGHGPSICAADSRRYYPSGRLYSGKFHETL